MKQASGAFRIGMALVLCGASVSHAGAAAPAPRDAGPTAAAAGAPSVTGDGIVASIANHPITMDQLLGPLVEAHGLTVLLNIVQLELAKDLATREGVTVTDVDFAQERKDTLDRLFAEGDEKMQEKIDAAMRKNQPQEAERLRKDLERDHEQLFDQFLQNQKVTKAEFELVLKTNTYLRKIAEPKIDKAITDEELRKSFETEYGASVVVRHIQGLTAAEVSEALAKVKAGKAFEEVAKELSRNPRTAALGGELPRFSLATSGLPENFKVAAFGLQVGEISNIIEAEGAYHVIKLEQKIAPRAVKFENVKESVRRNLKDRGVQAAVKQYRNLLAERARKELKVSEPVMASQYASRLADRDRQIQDQKEIRRQLQRERERDAERNGAPATPGATPTPAPVTDLPAAPATPGVEPSAPASPAPVAPAPAGGVGAAGGGGKGIGAPIKPGIVVPVPSRAVPAPGAATEPPARATEPAQGPQSAPAGK